MTPIKLAALFNQLEVRATEAELGLKLAGLAFSALRVCLYRF